MKKLFTAVFLFVALMMASKTTFASEIIINDPDVQVIVEKGDSPLSNIKGRVDHYTDIYTYGLSRPMSAHNLVKGYNFGVSASASDIYSNYYFTNHNGRIHIYLDEYHGKGFFDKTYKFYFYEQGSNKLIMSTSLDKGEKVTVHVLNLSTSKGYYFKIVPNNQTNISGKVYR